MIKKAGKLLFIVILVVSMFSYAMFQGGFVSWFLFYSMMPLLFYSLAIGLFPMKSIRIERYLSSNQMLKAGHSLKVTVTIYKSYFPFFYLIVEDILPQKLKSSLRSANDAKALFFPLFKRTLTFTYEIPVLLRGEYIFSDVRLKTGDPFGFLQKQTIVQEIRKMIVYPQIQRMDWMPKKQSVLQGSVYGRQSHNDVTTVVGIRDYVPGDRLSWLDWKATAKRNKLVTKQFEHQKNKKVQIILDNSADSYAGDNGDLFEKTVSAAASIARQVIAMGGVVSIPTVADEGVSLQSTASRKREQQLFYHLAKVEAIDPIPFSERVNHAVFSERATLIFITPVFSKALLFKIEQLIFRNWQIECFYVKTNNNDQMGMIGQLQRAGIPVQIIDGSIGTKGG